MNEQERTIRSLQKAGDGAVLRVASTRGIGNGTRKIYGVFAADGTRYGDYETTAVTVQHLARARRIEQVGRDEWRVLAVSPEAQKQTSLFGGMK